jgi:hypothetical protein
MGRQSDIGGANFAALILDLDAALGELFAPTADNAEGWAAARPRKWTAGQHTEHVIVVMERTAEAFAAVGRTMRSGALGPLPGRGPLQRLWVSLLFGGWMPRGLPTARFAYPGDQPERAAVLTRGMQALAAHREIGDRLSPEERDRLWIRNPFHPEWHYKLPEMVRVHAVHARHHARQVAEIAAGPGSR